MTQENTPTGYFWEPADRGRLCVIRFKAPHYTGGGEVVARHVEMDLAKTICSALNSYASSQAEIGRLRGALEDARKGLDMVHNGLMDSTRPRQSVGEVCAHFLGNARAALK